MNRVIEKKERYAIYLSPEVGLVLRTQKARKKGLTISSIVERAIRAKYRPLAPEVLSSSA